MKKRKLFVTAVVVILFQTILFAKTPTDHLNIGKAIVYNETIYNLGWSSHPNYDLYIQEYFPKGEKPESYNNMYSITVDLRSDVTVDEFVAAKVRELDERKKTDKVCHYQVLENNGEFIVHLVVSQASTKEANKIGMVEFDIQYYHMIEINNRKVLQLDLFSHREYGDNILPFLSSLNDKLNDYINAITKMDVKPDLSH
ncbi:MAG: hypothetical protein MJ010_05555 [Paludibacteraceae bacterium]|nr:hypothetical protein [Paludibacteraceae bacterium]